MVTASVDGKTGDELAPLADKLADKVAEDVSKQDDKLVLVQVDPEYVFSKAERGRPRVVALDHEAFGATAANLNVMSPIMACFTTADITLPKVRYICNPELPAMQGTTKVAA